MTKVKKCPIKNIPCVPGCPLWSRREGRCIEPVMRAYLNDIKKEFPSMYQIGIELISENAGVAR
jgi:hypothetical protein